MPLDAIIKLIIEQSAPVALAIFAMVVLNSVWKERVAEVERHAVEIDQMRKDTLAALRANTEAVTRLCERDR